MPVNFELARTSLAERVFHVCLVAGSMGRVGITRRNMQKEWKRLKNSLRRPTYLRGRQGQRPENEDQYRTDKQEDGTFIIITQEREPMVRRSRT